MCRSLPYEALLAQLSQAVGEHVNQGNLRYSLTQAFGEDASLKAQAYIGVSIFTKCVPWGGGEEVGEGGGHQDYRIELGAD